MTSLPDLLKLSRTQLLASATERGVDLRPNLTHDELAHAIAMHMMANDEAVTADGILDILPEGFGFVRMLESDFASSAIDTYVSANQVRSLNLQPGHRIRGRIRAPRGNERTFALVHIDRVEDAEPDQLMNAQSFRSLEAGRSERRVSLHAGPVTNDTDAMLDALQTLAPLSFGHRMLVHSNERFARATLLATITAALRARHPRTHLTLCLLDQRPEDIVAARERCDETTDLCSTVFAAPPERHVAVLELAWQRCLRRVEQGDDVVLLLDSVTALTRARSRSTLPSGSWIQPGLDARAILLAKEVLASAVQSAAGGSLTVIATVTRGEPGSIDEAIEREFARLTNSDVVIDGDVACEGICFDPATSRSREPDDAGTRDLRKELAALPVDERTKTWRTRAAHAGARD